MDDINQSHSDNVEDIQHQLDLELGMGLRADKKKISRITKKVKQEKIEIMLNLLRNDKKKKT